MDSRRVGGVTCGALDVGFPHFLYQRFHLRRQRQQIPVLATAGYDVARVVTGNFSNVPEMAPVAVHRHCPIVQDSTGRSMSKHPAGLTHSRIGEIRCLIDAAVVILGAVGERDDELDARAALEQELDGYRNHFRHFVHGAWDDRVQHSGVAGVVG